MVIHLPNDAVIFVDSKVSPDLYMKAVSENDTLTRKELTVKYAGQIKKRVEELSKREYWKIQKESVDFAILFLAGEPLFSLAAQGDPDLIEYALQNRVLIATPVNLLALLRSVAYVWSQSEAYKNTNEIKLEVQKLYDSLGTVFDHMAGIGGGLEDAVKAYNQAMISIKARLEPPMRKILASGLAQDKIGKGKNAKSRAKRSPKDVSVTPLKLAGATPEQVEMMGLADEDEEDMNEGGEEATPGVN
jgi:DNA recombination protein RmuC